MAPRVREPLILEKISLGDLFGVVLGPADLPLMSARVEIPSLDVAALTNPDGEFVFRGLPVQPGPKELKVLAKGKEMTVGLESPLKSKEPLVIRMNLMEEEHA